ncbi:MAG: hypothetical protein DI538_14950 [Azospira oryzae]|nr:MAG: hypothetical protein DI538_14950 [Azospira oryzae]
MATDINLFDILVSPERSTEDRLLALADLRPFLESAEGIAKLAAAARDEASKEVKYTMLQMLCDIDSARISNHSVYIDTMASIACLEPERELRRLATHVLAEIAAHNSEVQEILALILTYDLDTQIQLASLNGLHKAVPKTADTIQALYAYIPVAPLACKESLLKLVVPLPLPDNAKLLLLFINPAEREQLRLAAVQELTNIAQLPTEVLAGITAALTTDSSWQVQDAIINLLRTRKQIDEQVFTHLFKALQQMPDRPELLELVGDRLTALAHLQPVFADLFHQTPSANLKMNLLSLLQNSENPQLIISALQDNNAYVREAAIPLLAYRFAQWQQQLEPVLAEVIRNEPLIALRRALADVLLQTGRKSAQTEAILTSLALIETDHGLKVKLASAVCQVVITDSNRHDLLQLFCEVIEGAWYPDKLKDQVIERLKTFSYTDDAGFKRCLALLLEQAKDTYELERSYELLKTLKTDWEELAPVLMRLLLRHIGSYPQAPLADWVQLLGKMADHQAGIRSAVPWMIQLTGANWLLKNAEKSEQTGAFLAAFKQALMTNNGMASFMGMQRLITEAWENRTIKKAELIELYGMLLRMPKSTGLVQLVLGIMQEGKLVTPEIIDISLRYILYGQDASTVYEVASYLEKLGFMDLSYRMKLTELFTQDHYNEYMQYHAPDTQSKHNPATLNDWEYSGWACAYNNWPIARLAFALAPGDLLLKIFNAPLPAVHAQNTLQYLVLEHLFRNGTGTWAKAIFKEQQQYGSFLLKLAYLYRQLPVGNVLSDRLVITFWKKWNDYLYLLNKQPVTPELSEAVSIIYAGVLGKLKELDPDFNGKQYPTIPKEMNKEALQQRWPFTTEMWEDFAYKHFPVNNAAQEAAIALYQQAAKNMEAGKWQEGYDLLKELLTLYPQTKFVKEKQEAIEKTIKMIEERQ